MMNITTRTLTIASLTMLSWLKSAPPGTYPKQHQHNKGDIEPCSNRQKTQTPRKRRKRRIMGGPFLGQSSWAESREHACWFWRKGVVMKGRERSTAIHTDLPWNWKNYSKDLPATQFSINKSSPDLAKWRTCTSGKMPKKKEAQSHGSLKSKDKVAQPQIPGTISANSNYCGPQ